MGEETPNREDALRTIGTKPDSLVINSSGICGPINKFGGAILLVKGERDLSVLFITKKVFNSHPDVRAYMYALIVAQFKKLQEQAPEDSQNLLALLDRMPDLNDEEYEKAMESIRDTYGEISKVEFAKRGLKQLTLEPKE